MRVRPHIQQRIGAFNPSPLVVAGFAPQRGDQPADRCCWQGIALCVAHRPLQVRDVVDPCSNQQQRFSCFDRHHSILLAQRAKESSYVGRVHD